MEDSSSVIAFFDVETTVPCRAYTGYALLEFGAILVCPRRLVEVGSYSTLIRPPDLAAISITPIRCNGITKDAVACAPPFLDVADSVFNVLHGRVWGGHNIVRFDCVRIKEAFAEIGRPAPEPKGIIDTLPLLTQWFGTRAGDMKESSCPDVFSLVNLVHNKTPFRNQEYRYAGYLEPDQVLPHHITARPHQSSRRISLLYRDCPLQLCCMGTRIQFGVSTKFMDNAGRPKFSFVVDAPENLCKVLDACDQVAQVSSQNSGSNSEWRPLLKWNDYSNSFNIRLHIPIMTNGDRAIYSTEMHHKDPNGNMQKLVFSQLDALELDSIFVPGIKIDAYFGTDIYDFQHSAGIKLVARRLVVHSR